jgi:hypothetical protein
MEERVTQSLKIQDGKQMSDEGQGSEGIFVMGSQREYIPKEVLDEMAGEGITREQVIKLLTEMKMVDECGEDIEEEEIEIDQEKLQESWMEVIESLLKDIIPSVQEFKDENKENEEVGYGILEMPDDVRNIEATENSSENSSGWGEISVGDKNRR